MDVIEAIYHRRSVRGYKPDAVPRDAIDAVIAAAVHAPSAMNLQPWAFILIEGRQQLSRYAERAKRHLIETMSSDSPLSQYRDQLSDPAFDIFYGAPALIVVAATSDATQSAEDCCMAAQNLLLAAGGMGLGSCCIGFARPWLNLPDVKSELGIPDHYVPIVPIVVGYMRSAALRVPRKVAEVYRIGKDSNPSPQRAAQRCRTQPESRQFDEPTATETPEDPGTNVAAARYDAPLDPSAPTRTPSPEACGPLGEDRSYGQ
jgi:nitroreductase